MKKILILSLLMLATAVWATGQQSGVASQGGTGQATSPETQAPETTPPQSAGPGGATQPSPQSGTQGAPTQNVTVTEGCLGGTNPNYTVTDATGRTYKLNIPVGADASQLQSHIGEPVAVLGAVNGRGASQTSNQTSSKASIDVAQVAKGKGQCPSASNSPSAPPATSSR